MFSSKDIYHGGIMSYKVGTGPVSHLGATPPTDPPKKGFVIWWLDAWREGYKMETMSSHAYCREKTQAVAGKAFEDCIITVEATKQFARWHRLN